jgi:hypothetical protein
MSYKWSQSEPLWTLQVSYKIYCFNGDTVQPETVRLYPYSTY